MSTYVIYAYVINDLVDQTKNKTNLRLSDILKRIVQTHHPRRNRNDEILKIKLLKEISKLMTWQLGAKE